MLNKLEKDAVLRLIKTEVSKIETALVDINGIDDRDVRRYLVRDLGVLSAAKAKIESIETEVK